jgi:hypothetical protein
MKPRYWTRCAAALVVMGSSLVSVSASAESFISVEGSQVWQTKNDQRIPGTTGTLFSLSDLKSGPFTKYRIYAGHIWDDRHEVRLLYAPLQVSFDTQLPSSVFFVDSTFAAGTPTTALYRFNSYRATYAYHFDPVGAWKLAFGFTAKIRDAEVRLTQGALTRTKTNVGFVPLLNFQAVRDFGQDWSLRFDFDGLAAPQGRAFDVALFLERAVAGPLRAFGGYRMVEGGADNDQVYNFAWFHYATLGLRADF